MELLSEIGQATAAVSDAAGPAVVVIGRHGRGNGVVVTPGRVLTNAHNLRDRTTRVTFADGTTAQASVAGLDVDGDLAVLDVDTGDITPVTWADPAPLQQGSPLFAVSRPLGGGLRVTFGTVSSTQQAFRGPRGRRVGGAFEHTAPLPRGSSGGPVTDAQGHLLGINTSRIGHGFYLALPASTELRARVDALAEGRSPERFRLGVGLAPSDVANRLRRAVGLPERAGLLVQTVQESSPAAVAGLERGDLLVAAGDQPLERIDDLMATLDRLSPGQTLTLTVVRGDQERSVTVTFEAS